MCYDVHTVLHLFGREHFEAFVSDVGGAHFLRSATALGTKNKQNEVWNIPKACAGVVLRPVLSRDIEGGASQLVERSNLAPQCCVPQIVFLLSITSTLGCSNGQSAITRHNDAKESEQIQSFTNYRTCFCLGTTVLCCDCDTRMPRTLGSRLAAFPTYGCVRPDDRQLPLFWIYQIYHNLFLVWPRRPISRLT